MFRTLYAAMPYETPLSLMTALASTTRDLRVRTVSRQVVRDGPKLLQTCPCRLSRFCALTDSFYGGPRQVLTERTLYPLYLGCMSAAMASRMEDQVCNGVKSRPCGPTLPVHLHSANRYGLECPECSEYAASTVGRRCSLSFQCIPLQTRCPIHGCRYQLADACSSYEFDMFALPEGCRSKNSTRLSEMLLTFLSSTTSQCQLATTISMLRERGYMSENGRVKRSALERDFAAIFSSGFEDMRLSMWLNSNCMITHLLKCITHAELCAHPIEISLLRLALSEIEYVLPRRAKGRRSCSNRSQHAH